MIRVLQDNIKNVENHISATMFKMAGEQAVMGLILADKIIGDFSPETLRQYRNDAYEMVRRRHGHVTFDDAYENALEISESEGDY